MTEAAPNFEGLLREALAPVEAVVLPPEGDAIAVARDQATVGDGDPVGVAREIGEHGLGTAEGAFGVDYPLDRARRRQILR